MCRWLPTYRAVRRKYLFQATLPGGSHYHHSHLNVIIWEECRLWCGMDTFVINECEEKTWHLATLFNMEYHDQYVISVEYRRLIRALFWSLTDRNLSMSDDCGCNKVALRMRNSHENFTSFMTPATNRTFRSVDPHSNECSKRFIKCKRSNHFHIRCCMNLVLVYKHWE